MDTAGSTMTRRTDSAPVVPRRRSAAQDRRGAVSKERRCYAAVDEKINGTNCDGGVKKSKPTTLRMPSHSNQSIRIITKIGRTERNSFTHTHAHGSGATYEGLF